MDITDSFLEKIVFNTHLFSLEFLKILSPHMGVLTLPWKKKPHKKTLARRCFVPDQLKLANWFWRWSWKCGKFTTSINMSTYFATKVTLAFGSVLNSTEKYAPQCTMIFNPVSSHECDRFICLSLSQWEILESLQGGGSSDRTLFNL